MMELMHFSLGIILLAIGFGVGYWLLITAIKQDKKLLRILGSVLGWILITLVLFQFLLGFYFANTANKMHGCPMNKMMQQEKLHQPNDRHPEMMDDEK